MGVSSARARSADKSWQHWCEFCIQYNIDELLAAYDDPIPALQLYIRQYRDGSGSPSKRSVRARTVEQALRTVGQTLAGMGRPDPRLNHAGKIDFRLQRQLAAYARADPPPSRVKPIPLPILQHAATLNFSAHHPRSHAVADMLILAFFFLLRPGEYALATAAEDSHAFRIADAHCFIGNRRLDVLTCPEGDLWATTRVGLEFTTQKNAVRGEIIGHARSGSPLWCPVLALVRRIVSLRRSGAPRTQPIYSYSCRNTWYAITPSHLTQVLRQSVLAVGHLYGILPDDVSVRSLRASGAMALLCGNIDGDRIRLLGRWRSDEMLRYLHVQAFPARDHLAATMLHHGAFSLIPNQPRVPPA